MWGTNGKQRLVMQPAVAMIHICSFQDFLGDPFTEEVTAAKSWRRKAAGCGCGYPVLQMIHMGQCTKGIQGCRISPTAVVYILAIFDDWVPESRTHVSASILEPLMFAHALVTLRLGHPPLESETVTTTVIQ